MARCSQIVPLGSGSFRRVERGSGTAAASCDLLESTPAQIQVRVCQACDAGSRSQNGGGQWGGSLDIYSPTLASSLSSFQCAECVDYEPVFGGPRFSVRASGTQDPRRLIPSCALHCLFCGSRNCWWFRHCLLQVAFHVLRGSWICVGKRVRSRIHVVVCSYCSSSCRCVWDRGRLCIAL